MNLIEINPLSAALQGNVMRVRQNQECSQKERLIRAKTTIKQYPTEKSKITLNKSAVHLLEQSENNSSRATA